MVQMIALEGIERAPGLTEIVLEGDGRALQLQQVL